jgi:uncharacterized OB-fold protein
MGKNIELSGLPLPDVENPEWSSFWEGTRQKEIRFPRCQECKQFHFYPSWLCPFCHSPNIEWQALTSQPRLFTWTYVRRNLSPVYLVRGPYIVALVEFDEAPDLFLTTNLLECQPEDIYIGMPLEAVFQQVDDMITLPFFRPVQGE